MAVNIEDGVNKLTNISPKFTKEIALEMLTSVLGSDAHLVEVKVADGSARGDSYLSTVSRVTLKGSSPLSGQSTELSLIVKSLPANIGRRKTFRSTEFFSNEVAFYEKALPGLLDFQKQKKTNNAFHEIPRCFKAVADGENDFIALADLSVEGFETSSRMEGLSFDYCAKMLEVLGRFHALSFAMKDQDPEEFKKIASMVKETYYYQDNKWWYEKQLQQFCIVAEDAVSKEYPGTIYEEKLKQLTQNNLYERMVALSKPEEPYAVISHGDTWAPNFLFKCEDGVLKEMRIIDFQLARYSSPVLDLSFLIYSCTTKEMRNVYYTDLLKVYYKSLSGLIRDLGSDPDVLFPYSVFEGELTAYCLFGLGMSLESVPLSIMEPSETPDIDQIVGSDAVPLEDIWKVYPIKTKEGRLRLADNFVHVVDMNYFRE